MGWQHERVDQVDYDAFVDAFIQAVKKRWPNVLLQFEDFEQKQAQPLLDRYQDELCCFNDDIQGTAAVTVGTLMAACAVKGEKLADQTYVFVGAGSAGCGIAAQLIAHMMKEGLSEQDALDKIFMMDRYGLMTDSAEHLNETQQALAQSQSKVSAWSPELQHPDLASVVEHVQPTVLIGVSGQPGLFDEALIASMSSYCASPIVFPLSNPSKRIEAHPADLLLWTQGNAIVATGSPFDPIEIDGQTYDIPQCNNSYIFPGLGLAVVAANITRLTEAMMMVASESLANISPLIQNGQGSLLPPLKDSVDVSRAIAFDVAKYAIESGFAVPMSDDALEQAIEKAFWKPEYRQYVLTGD
jgi:malate dehydrogenase (oxaloacetate-decarboxylating)